MIDKEFVAAHSEQVISDDIMNAWKAGVSHFNEKRYWLAHEEWEHGWKNLPPLEKKYVQALIQSCATLHHLQNGNLPPARALAKLALEKFEDVAAHGEMGPSVIQVPGLASWLGDFLNHSNEAQPAEWVERALFTANLVSKD